MKLVPASNHNNTIKAMNCPKEEGLCICKNGSTSCPFLILDDAGTQSLTSTVIQCDWSEGDER